MFEYFGNDSGLTIPAGSGFLDININDSLIVNGAGFVATSNGIEVSASGNFTVEVHYNITARGSDNNNTFSYWALYRNGIFVPGTLSEMYHDFSEENGYHSVSRTAIVNVRGNDVLTLKGSADSGGDVYININGATLLFKTL